ncbi:MAG: beta-galactosidase, partial [Bacillota bacterium]
MGKIRIGSQLFINKDNSPEEVKAWVEKMAESKLQLIRLFVFWDHVEPKDGVWNFTNYDTCFEVAQKNNLKVVPTLMSVSPPGWMRCSTGPQSPGDLDDRELWERSKIYIKKLVNRYKDAAALDSYILWNEASRVIKPNPNSMREFRKFLKKRYDGDIEKLNEVYFYQYKDFAEVQLNEKEGYYSDFSGYTERLDWIRFTVNNLIEKLGDIRKEILKYDKEHPIHVNPHNLASNVLPGGQSIWREAEVTDFLGCSAHPAWHSTRFPEDRIHQSIALFADLMKSATPADNKYFWVSELQGGTTITSSTEYRCPQAQDIKHWLWESIGAGAKGIVYWCFNTRNSGYEAGEWGLMNRLEEPSPRLEVTTDIIETLENDVFAKTSIPEAKITILHSESNIALSGVEGRETLGKNPENPRNNLMAVDAISGAYLMCSDLGYQTEFVDENLLKTEGWMEHSKFLILPGITTIDLDSLHIIEKFIQKGGYVIADGLLAMKNENGNLNKKEAQKAAEIFGAQMVDIEAMQEDFTVESEQDFPGWFLRVNLKNINHGKVIGKFENSNPAVIERNYKKGKTMRLGTIFFQQYFVNQDQNLLRFFKSFLNEINIKSIKLKNQSHNLRMKKLNIPDGKLLILINYGEAKTAL